jgi:SAM-dependent methyltransferase
VDRSAAKGRTLLTRGSLDHYADPAYYDQSYRDRISDVAFYVTRAVASRGPVLEYGIGHGRVALPIARHGVSVTGIDHSGPMLAELKRRRGKLPITIARGDMRTLKLKKKFPLVIAPFNGVLHLYTRGDVQNFFERVREHLAPGGSFICDLNVPSMVDLMRDPKRAYRTPAFVHPSAGRVKYEETFDYDARSQVLTVHMRFFPTEGEPFEQILTHRQFFPKEWEALLHYNGLEITEQFGDFENGGFDKHSDVMVVVCKKRRT